jgi:ribose transport system substrate-binding protein
MPVLPAPAKLAQWAKHQFEGKVDEIILVGRLLSGPLRQSRLKGMEMGFREVLPSAQHARLVHLNGEGEFSRSLDAVRKYLRFSLAERTLVGALNDSSALGALCAFHEAGRTANCGVVSQGASAEGRAELRNIGTRLVGSVGYLPRGMGGMSWP